MARLKALEIDEVEPIAQEMYEKSIEATGKVLNLFKVLSHSQKIARDWNRFGTTLLRKGKLAAGIRELAIIRVGELAHSQYELTAHRAIGLQVGLTQEQIDAIADWEGADVFSAKELAVLQYTDEVAKDIAATDRAFGRLEDFFTPEEIVELTVNIGFYGMVVRILESLQVDMES